MFPNNRNENDTTFATSPTSSSNPTKNRMGFLKLRYFPMCFKSPMVATPTTCTMITLDTASAKVMSISEFTERKNGMSVAPCSPASYTPTEPTSGKMPIQFESSTKKNMVPTMGKNRSACVREPTTSSTNETAPSTTASTAFCRKLFGTSASERYMKNATPISTAIASHAMSSVLVTGNTPSRVKIFSAEREICTVQNFQFTISDFQIIFNVSMFEN